MELRVREWRFSNGIFGHVPADPGPCGAVLVVHGPTRDAANSNTARWLGFLCRQLQRTPSGEK